MPDHSLLRLLSSHVSSAFGEEGLDPALGAVKLSDRPDLAPFQCNGALAAAKAAKTNPRALAERIKQRLEDGAVFADVTLAGPGFLNLTPHVAFTEGALADLQRDPLGGAFRTPNPEKVVLDYGGPNIAKMLHVGHLRAAIIGQSVKLIMRRAGDDAAGDIHLGDWGAQMGQLLAEMKRRHPELPYFDDTKTSGYPAESPVTAEDLGEIYPAASAACKEDEGARAEAQRATAELQEGRPGYRALWQHFVDVSLAPLRRDYGELGVDFELWRGEASVHPLIAPLAEELTAKGLLEVSDGAKVVRVARPEDSKDIPPLMMFKGNGAVGYGSTDLATLVERKNDGFARCVYIVDKRQAGHFVQVFRAAALMGLYSEDQLEHAGFGTMNGKDGKPFKTRAGGTMPLRGLVDQVLEKAAARVAESNVAASASAEDRAEVARLVGMAALKFADLSNPRTTDYIFDVDRFTAFEGKTGPYLLYAAVRMASVLKKAEIGQDDALGAAISLNHPTELGLAYALLGYEDAHRLAYERRMPHHLCDHAFSLAQAFSRFYTECPIAQEKDETRRKSRLALTAATLRQLADILGQLGIGIPAEM